MRFSILLSNALIAVIFVLFLGTNVAYSTAIENDNLTTTKPTVIDPSLKVQNIVSNLIAPSNMAFLGNNDILVLERYNGEVRRIINETLQPDPFLDVNVAAG